MDRFFAIAANCHSSVKFHASLSCISTVRDHGRSGLGSTAETMEGRAWVESSYSLVTLA